MRVLGHNLPDDRLQVRTVAQPSTRDLDRSDEPHCFGGRVIGATVIGRHRAPDLTPCDCCSDLIEAGGPVLDVITRTGERRLVCVECGPR